jgi:hypothetical protein
MHSTASRPDPLVSRPRRGTRPRRALLGALGAAGLLWSLGACGSTLYKPTDIRTQYDRYDRTRNDFAPPYIEDEFGRPEPNLRGRLLQGN